MKTVIILGMHRSGTSIVSRILNDVGVDMGQHFVPNHYEDLDFFNLNKEILQEAKGSWKHPPSHINILNTKERFEQKIQDLFSKKQKQLWGWKDPRTSLTIELFKDYLVNPIFIYCRRNSADCSKSLIRRGDGLSFNEGKKLADEYKKRIEIFLETSSANYITIDYEFLINKPNETIKKLLDFIGIKKTSSDLETLTKLIKPKHNYIFPNKKILWFITGHNKQDWLKKNMHKYLKTFLQSRKNDKCIIFSNGFKFSDKEVTEYLSQNSIFVHTATNSGKTSLSLGVYDLWKKTEQFIKHKNINTNDFDYFVFFHWDIIITNPNYILEICNIMQKEEKNIACFFRTVEKGSSTGPAPHTYFFVLDKCFVNKCFFETFPIPNENKGLSLEKAFKQWIQTNFNIDVLYPYQQNILNLGLVDYQTNEDFFIHTHDIKLLNYI